jgi:hypothetical protein
MTMFLGVNLGDAVVLAADGRRTMSSGERVDDVQKLVKITDTVWSAGAGNLPLTTYIQGVLAERPPANVTAYLKVVQTFAQKALRAHAELFDTLARHNPALADHTGATVMSVLLVGGFDPVRNAMVLYGFGSDTFEPCQNPLAASIGGRPQDEEMARVLLGVTLGSDRKGPEDVANMCQLTLQEVAKVACVGPS